MVGQPYIVSLHLFLLVYRHPAPYLEAADLVVSQVEHLQRSVVIKAVAYPVDIVASQM